MKENVLRGPKEYTEDGHRYRMTVHGGLNYIRGNSAPYFSVTADIRISEGGYWREHSGGCCHDEVLKQHPDLADLVALHLSDMNGAPMYAEANGWYNLAGALGGMGEQYHIGNSEGHYPITPPADKPWKTTEYRLPTTLECMEHFAHYCRLSLDEANRIASEVCAELGPIQEDANAPGYKKSDYARARKRWKDICATMKPRWKAEADAVIAKHGLKVYGDDWKAA